MGVALGQLMGSSEALNVALVICVGRCIGHEVVSYTRKYCCVW